MVCKRAFLEKEMGGRSPSQSDELHHISITQGIPPNFLSIVQLLKRDTNLAGISLKDKNSARGFLRLANKATPSQF